MRIKHDPAKKIVKKYIEIFTECYELNILKTNKSRKVKENRRKAKNYLKEKRRI
jgi:hypothetical protein